MDDIRIIRQIGILAENDDGSRKEFNIVSINGEALCYDIRDWALDYSSHGSGFSMDSAAAGRLLNYLQECYQNGFDMGTAEMEGIQPKADEVEMFLKQNQIQYIDKRNNGGSLWVVGGHELDSVMMKASELGYKFQFSEKGGKVTKHMPGWYIKV